MSIKRACNHCGNNISLRKMPNGQWVAFDFNTNSAHKCATKQSSKTRTSTPERTTKNLSPTPKIHKTTDTNRAIITPPSPDNARANDYYQNTHTDAILNLINLAIKDGDRLRINYYTASRNAWTTRDIKPMLIYHEHAYTYTRGYCYLRNEERTFRLDRIKSAELLKSTTPIPIREEPSESLSSFQGPSAKQSEDYSWIMWAVILVAVIMFLAARTSV